ncbi:hypothetical protein TELCIR_16379, partial [Teladorsagia circumcincta]
MAQFAKTIPGRPWLNTHVCRKQDSDVWFGAKTPMFGMDDAAHFLEGGEWVMEDLFVTIKSNHDEDRFQDCDAIVTSVQDGRFHVYIPNMKCSATADFDQIEPLGPQEIDYTRVIYGDELGVMGQLISVDEVDCVIKVAEDDM